MKKYQLKPVVKIEVKKPIKPVQRGKWVYKPIRSAIIVCACGNKYVSTRVMQKTCVQCIQDA